MFCIRNISSWYGTHYMWFERTSITEMGSKKSKIEVQEWEKKNIMVTSIA
jgi:hypothetical protein